MPLLKSKRAQLVNFRVLGTFRSSSKKNASVMFRDEKSFRVKFHRTPSPVARFENASNFFPSYVPTIARGRPDGRLSQLGAPGGSLRPPRHNKAGPPLPFAVRRTGHLPTVRQHVFASRSSTTVSVPCHVTRLFHCGRSTSAQAPKHAKEK